MSRVIEIPLDDVRGHLVEPPIIDSLTVMPDRQSYAILLVPDPHTSAAEKVAITVSTQTPEGRRITGRLDELAARLGGKRPIARIVHGGGGDFVFHFTDGASVSLADDGVDAGTTLWTYTRVQDLAIAAEIAFRLAHSSAA
jgi:hypothetical protein